jgi:PilZ domain
MSEINARDRLEFDSDRRQNTRVEIETGVVLQFSGREFVLVAKDISTGGLAASPNNEIVEFSEGLASFAIGDDQRPISCRCRVIYSVDGRGIGVEFLDLGDDSRFALKKFVDESN